MALIRSGYLFKLDNVTKNFEEEGYGFDRSRIGVCNFLEKNIDKCMKNQRIKPGEFLYGQGIHTLIVNYQNKKLELYDIASEIARFRYNCKSHYGICTNSNLFICEVEHVNGNYLIGIELQNGETINYRIEIGELGVNKALMLDNTSVSGFKLSNSSFFAIDDRTGEVLTLEKSVRNDGYDSYLYADCVLGIKSGVSIKEAVERVKEVVSVVVKEYELDKLEVYKALDVHVNKAINSGKDISFENMSEKLFYYDKSIEKFYLRTLEMAGFNGPVKNKAKIKRKDNEKDKIFTSTGIEIILPAGMCKDSDLVEVSKDKDGMIDIKIKQVSNIEVA